MSPGASVDVEGGKEPDAPFLIQESAEERIDPASGSLSLTYTDLHLPGKNGMDLVIQRRYNSSGACKHQTKMTSHQTSDLYYWWVGYRVELYKDMYGYYDTAGAARAAGEEARADPFWDDIEKPNQFKGRDEALKKTQKVWNYYTGAVANSHLPNLFGLGWGWSFNIPSIEEVPGHEKGKDKTDLVLHLEDGRTFSQETDYETNKEKGIGDGGTAPDLEAGEGYIYLKGYSLLDFQWIRVPAADPNYSYKIKYKDGRTFYFDKNKLPSHWEDRFGNTIRYAFDGQGRLASVTDTYGRVFRLVRSGATLSWQSGGGTEYTYTVTDGKLAKTEDKEGRATTYVYQDVSLRTVNGQSIAGDGGASLTYCNLIHVRYPTDAFTEYTYTTIQEEYGIYAGETYRTYPALSSRQDRCGRGQAAVNRSTYSYKTHGQHYRENYPQNRTFYYPRRDYINFTTHTDSRGVVTVYEFNAAHLNIGSTTSCNGATLATTETKYGGVASGHDYRLPNWEKATRFHGSAAMTKTTSTFYHGDKKGNVAQVVEEYSAEPDKNQTTAMKYGAYSILTEKAWYQDAGTQLIERNTLRADGKLVEEQRLLVRKGGAETLKERIRYEYDGQNRLVAELRFHNGTGGRADEYLATAYTYGGAGNDLYSPSPVTKQISNVRDVDGTMVSSPYGGGILRETFSYDWYGRVERQTDPCGNTVEFAYDGLGRVIRETHPATGGFRYVKATAYRDAAAETVVTETVSATQSVSHRYAYTPLGKIRQVYISSTGTAETLLAGYSYDTVAERLVEEVAYNGAGAAKLTTRYSNYDHLDRYREKTVSGSGVSTRETHSYEDVFFHSGEGSCFLRHTAVLAGDSNAESITTVSLTDQLDNQRLVTVNGTAIIRSTHDKLGSCLTHYEAGLTTAMEYDHAGRVVVERNAVGQEIHTAYDALGNKVQVQNRLDTGDIRTTTLDYDGAGRLLRQTAPFDGVQNAVTEYAYDGAGRVTMERVLRARGNWATTRHSYNARGMLTDTILYEANGSENRTRYEYDGLGNKTAQYTGMQGNSTAGAAKTGCAYDRFGNLTAVTDPMGGVERYSYDAVGLLLSKTDRNGVTIAYEYDGADRPLREKNGSTVLRELSYTATGQTRQEKNGNLTITYRYNGFGWLESVTESNGMVKEYGYYPSGSRQSFRLIRDGAQAMYLYYTYDGLNRLEQVRRDGPAGTLLAQYGYDLQGNRRTLTYPEAGIATTYGYNKANLAVSLVSARGGVTYSSYTYTYALDGNQLVKADKVSGITTSYTYDPMGRLTKEATSEGNAMSYGYDRFSNRAWMLVEERNGRSARTEYAYDLRGRLLTETETQGNAREIWHYRYDNNGNQLSREWERYETAGTTGGVTLACTKKERLARLETREYNEYNQLTGVWGDGERYAYAHRPDGLRHSKTVGGAQTVHLWDGQDMVAELGAAGGFKARYYRGANLLLQEVDGNPFYYLHNAHGDVARRVQPNGTSAPAYGYDAFGWEQDPPETDPNPFRYCGEYFDAELENYYLRAREYDPRTGRFSGEDPERDGINWYSYGNGNPIRYNDPSGLSVRDILDGLFTSLDDNIFQGTVKWLSNLLNPNYCERNYWDSEKAYQDYHLGKVIGDALSFIVGITEIVTGVMQIIASIGGGGAVTVGSGGLGAGVAVPAAAAGVAAGAAVVAHGASVVLTAGSNFSDDFEAMLDNYMFDESNTYDWGKLEELLDHYERHGEDFGAQDHYDYARMANEFYNNRSGFEIDVDRIGTTRVYDRKTNTFGSYNSDGTTKTFFKPKEGARYFDEKLWLKRSGK